MPQVQLPIFPRGVTLITPEIAFQCEEGKVCYFNFEGLHGMVRDRYLSEDEYERFFTPERLEEINAGQRITEDEFLALRDARLERLLDPCTDADVTTGYSFVEVVDDEGNAGIALF